MNKKTETSMTREFLLWTFGIAWGSELILIAGKYLSILTGTLGVAVQYLVIGFGAGAAPAYACYIVYRKRGKIKGLKDFMGLIFRVTSLKKTALVMAVAAFSQLLLCLMFEDYLGGPWYLFILYIPLMIVGGGTEEVGWRGFYSRIWKKNSLLQQRHLLKDSSGLYGICRYGLFPVHHRPP